jgi:hypothetical protein
MNLFEQCHVNNVNDNPMSGKLDEGINQKENRATRQLATKPRVNKENYLT